MSVVQPIQIFLRVSSKHIQKNSFWLSLVCHSLLLTFLLFHWPFQKEKEQDIPSLTIPAYTYSEPNAFVAESEISTKETSVDNALLKPQKSIKNVSHEQIQTVHAQQATEAINLVGNKQIKKPLLALLGRALARTLVYPKIAMDFNLRGIAYVGFNLTPDGQVFDVNLMQSSGASVLDQAAIKGVTAIAPLRDVEQFLKEKKFIVVGIIFK